MQDQPTTKRSLQACLRCRRQKMKCSGGPSPCERCIKFDRECVFEPTQHPSPSLSRKNRESAYVSILPALTLDCGSGLGLHRSPTGNHFDHGQSPSLQFQSCSLSSPDTPYSTAQHLESQYSTSISPAMQFSHCFQQIQAKDQPECYISEVGIPLSEAEQMFMLFGERLALFIPSLYETDFSRLPSSPIFGLAALHAITRYLPDSTGLRSRLADRLYKLLENIIFHSLIHQSGVDADTIQGLVILYACCETGPVLDAAGGQDGFGMLTIKTIVEGYAVSMKIGIPDHEDSPNILSYVFWLWLYTMSHHSAILHGCERTMWASAGVHRAKAFVQQNIFHPRIKVLLGEVDLCMLWERVWAKPSYTKRMIDLELNTWRVKWNGFIAKVEGRQLIFHFLFTSFGLHKSITRSGDKQALEAPYDVDAAQAFLRYITGLPSVSKDRLRYMTDFGFVMLAYACEFILKAIEANSILEDRRHSLLQDVAEIANLMQSFSAQKETRPAIYGYALTELCQNVTSRFTNMADSSSTDLAGLANLYNPQRSMPPLNTNLSETLIGTDAICIPDDLQGLLEEKNGDDYWFQTVTALWDYGMGTNPYPTILDDSLLAVASAVPS